MKHNDDYYNHINDWDTRDMFLPDLILYPATVKCCNCDFKGHEEDLIITNDDGEYIKACPNCKTDWYLSDIQ